jgi:hypothetical protein
MLCKFTDEEASDEKFHYPEGLSVAHMPTNAAKIEIELFNPDACSTFVRFGATKCYLFPHSAFSCSSFVGPMGSRDRKESNQSFCKRPRGLVHLASTQLGRSYTCVLRSGNGERFSFG